MPGKNNLPELGSKKSVEAFRGAIALDHQAGVGGFAAELHTIYSEQEPLPSNIKERQDRENAIYRVINEAFKGLN